MNGIDELLLFLGSNPEEVRERGRGREGGRRVEREMEGELASCISFLFSFLQSQWCMHVLEITFLMLKEQVHNMYKVMQLL